MKLFAFSGGSRPTLEGLDDCCIVSVQAISPDKNVLSWHP